MSLLNLPDPSNSEEVVALRVRADAAAAEVTRSTKCVVDAMEQLNAWETECRARNAHLTDAMLEKAAAELALDGALARALRESMLEPAGAR